MLWSLTRMNSRRAACTSPAAASISAHSIHSGAERGQFRVAVCSTARASGRRFSATSMVAYEYLRHASMAGTLSRHTSL